MQKQLRIWGHTHPHPACADEAASAFAARLRLRFATTRSRRSQRRRRKSARYGATAAARRRPGPLRSDGRGRIVLRRSAYPTALEVGRDGAGCSLSRRTGYVFSAMVGMARCAVPARVVAGGTNVRATLAFEGVAPLHAARTSQPDVPTTLNRYWTGEGQGGGRFVGNTQP